MEQFLMFLVWIVFGVWMFACLREVSCFRCILIRYTGLIITLLVISALV